MKTKMKMKRHTKPYLIAGLFVAGVLLFMLGVSNSTVNFRSLELSPLQKNQMHHLGLEESEMHEFLLKREIYKGYIDTNRLSPHEVLGILSEDESKRRHYARAAARIRSQMIDSTRSFETLYLQEVSRLSNPG